MSETLEEHEKAREAAEGGRRYSALLIAVLAAGLAFSEQAAQQAQTALSTEAIAATDLWAQYQAKSIRANEAKNLAAVAEVAAPAGQARDDLVKRLRESAAHFETGKGGKADISAAALQHEHLRDAAHDRLESYDHASAALQLGIVLVTASVITGSQVLVVLGALLGLAGGIMGVVGFLRP
jgi:hypothetical protein